MNIKSRYFKSKIAVIVAALACPLLFEGCSVKYSLSGASIAPEIQTVSIARFPNNALLVAPILSSTLTDALQDRFTRQTRLAVVPENGDLRFEGEITNYTSTPAAVSGEEMAVMNRLTCAYVLPMRSSRSLIMTRPSPPFPIIPAHGCCRRRSPH